MSGFYTVVATDSVRTHSPRKRYGQGQVHSFEEYPAARRYVSELRNAYPDKNFRILHTIITESGDVWVEPIAVSEEDYR